MRAALSFTCRCGGGERQEKREKDGEGERISSFHLRVVSSACHGRRKTGSWLRTHGKPALGCALLETQRSERSGVRTARRRGAASDAEGDRKNSFGVALDGWCDGSECAERKRRFATSLRLLLPAAR